MSDDQRPLALRKFLDLLGDVDKMGRVLASVATGIEITRGAVERVVPVGDRNSLHGATLAGSIQPRSPSLIAFRPEPQVRLGRTSRSRNSSRRWDS